MQVKISVTKRVARFMGFSDQGATKLICGNTSDEVVFSFDEEWGAFPDRTALFVWNGKYYPVEFVGNTCKIPPISNVSSIRIGVYAGEHVAGEVQISSTYVKIPTQPSIRDYAKSAHNDAGKNYTFEAKGYAAEAKASANASAEASIRAENAAVRSETAAEKAEDAIVGIDAKVGVAIDERLDTLIFTK